MITKKEAIQKLKELQKRILDVEKETDKAWEIMSPRFKKVHNDEAFSMEEVREEDTALRELNAHKDWRKNTITCIEYLFNGKSSQVAYKDRVNALNFSISHNSKSRQGFIDADKLIMDMINEIDQYWSNRLVNKDEVEPPQIIKQLRWVRQQWNENKPLAIAALIIIIITTILFFYKI